FPLALSTQQQGLYPGLRQHRGDRIDAVYRLVTAEFLPVLRQHLVVLLGDKVVQFLLGGLVEPFLGCCAAASTGDDADGDGQFAWPQVLPQIGDSFFVSAHQDGLGVDRLGCFLHALGHLGGVFSPYFLGAVSDVAACAQATALAGAASAAGAVDVV